MAMIEWIKDKYLTWRTGYNKRNRIAKKWFDETIVYNANTVENKYMNFKHIIPVSSRIFNHSEPFGWYPCQDFKQYLWPERELGDNTVYSIERGYWNKWDGKFHINELVADLDQIFIATNNEQDAIIITLKYGC